MELVELLEFLSNAWPYLEFEFGYPFGLNPIRPAWLRSEAEVRWQSMPDELVREEEEELLAYEETHDLHEVYTDFSCPLFGS